MPRCTETPPAIIAKLRALASTNAPKTTNANVRSLVSRSVMRASAAIASPPTRGIAEYAARLANTLCQASRLRSESKSTETAPIITAGAGPHSAMASTRAKNVPVTRSALCLSASRSLAIASASSTTTSPTGRQSSAVEEATAATSVPSRITASAARSLLERAGMEVVSGGTPESEPPVPSQPSGSSRDVPPERPVAGAARQGRRSEGIPLVFRGSRTPPGGDRRPPISGETLREGPLEVPLVAAHRKRREDRHDDDAGEQRPADLGGHRSVVGEVACRRDEVGDRVDVHERLQRRRQGVHRDERVRQERQGEQDHHRDPLDAAGAAGDRAHPGEDPRDGPAGEDRENDRRRDAEDPAPGAVAEDHAHDEREARRDQVRPDSGVSTGALPSTRRTTWHASAWSAPAAICSWSVELPTEAFSSSGVPCATLRPRSMTAIRSAS